VILFEGCPPWSGVDRVCILLNSVANVERERVIGPVALLIPLGLALVAFGPAWSNGFTNWDDPLHLLSNPLTLDPLAEGLRGLLLTHDLGYPVPVTVLALAGERAVFGLDPLGYHLVSTALHLLVVAQATFLARRLGVSWLAAALAGSLLAVHPLVVEPVAWVVGQKDLLSAVFLLGAFLVRVGERGERPGRAAAVAVLLTLSILSKPNAVAAFLLLPALDAAVGRDPRARRNLFLYGAALAVALASSAVTLWLRDDMGVSPAVSLGARSLAEAGWAYSLQARHLLWPDPLLARYFPPGGTFLILSALFGLFLFAATAWGVALAWSRRRRAAGFGVAAAVLLYAPAAGVLPLTRGPADSYLYLPLAMLVIPFGYGIAFLVSRFRARNVAPLAVAVLLVATLVSRGQARVWRDAPTLWHEVAAAYPDEPRALMRLGDAYLFVGRPRVALEIYERLRERHPEFETSLLAQGHALMMLGRPVEAERVLAEGSRRTNAPSFLDAYAVFLIRHPRIAPTDPDTARAALLRIAPLLAERGRREPSLERAIQLLDSYGEREQAASLRKRLLEIRQRASATE